jgi:hypothetical protein
VDDIEITVLDYYVDGEGGGHGMATVSAVRESGSDENISYKGTLTIDEADIASMIQEGVLNDIILHELLHALGFGDGEAWEELLEDSQEYGGSYRFTGEAAIAAYNAQHPDIAAEDEFSDMGVQVESDYGTGNEGSHWDRATFDKTEGGLMAAGTSEYYYGGIDAMTLAAFEDMGYETVWDASDPGEQPGDYDELPAAVQDPDLADDAGVAMVAADDLETGENVLLAEDVDEDVSFIAGAENSDDEGTSLITDILADVGLTLETSDDSDHGLIDNLIDAFLDDIRGNTQDVEVEEMEPVETEQISNDTVILTSDASVDLTVMDAGISTNFSSDLMPAEDLLF